MKKRIRLIGVALGIILLMLACSTPSVVPTAGPNLEGTQVALALTQTALNNLPAQLPATPTERQAATATQEQQPPPTAEQDIQTLINSANILVYEDMVGYSEYITYVARALKSVGGHHEYVGDAMGTFMDKLDSGTKWDLIIVASEARGAISGDYWTVIKDKVDDGAALVAEVWYLNQIGDGKIGPFLSECGVKVQADWRRGDDFNPIDYEIYWADANSPVFNKPNQVSRFKASLTDPAWFSDIGDFLELTDNSKAEILASHAQGNDSSFGLITSCMDGRVILQTFDSHDYPTNDMVALWENYIDYTLRNHFLAGR